MNQLQGHFRWAFRTYLAGNLKLKLCRSQQPKKILQAATAATQQRQGKASNYYIYMIQMASSGGCRRGGPYLIEGSSWTRRRANFAG